MGGIRHGNSLIPAFLHLTIKEIINSVKNSCGYKIGNSVSGMLSRESCFTQLEND